MPLSRDSRAEKKLKGLLRAQFRFKQFCERVDFEEDVLYPEIEKLKGNKSVLGLPEGQLFDLVFERDANPRQNDTSGGNDPA